MKITIYEAKEIELTGPAYFRRKDGNVTNWFLKVDGESTVSTSQGLIHEGATRLILSNEFEPCEPEEFYTALAENLYKINSDNTALAEKWGLELCQLK